LSINIFIIHSNFADYIIEIDLIMVDTPGIPYQRWSDDKKYLIIGPGVESDDFKIDSPVTDLTVNNCLSLSATNRIVTRPLPVVGMGDVIGPASSTDNAVVRFDGITGKFIQNSGVIIDDSDNVTGVQNLNVNGKYTGTGEFDSSLILSDGSSAKLLISDNILSSGSKGVTMVRQNLSGIASSVGVVNAVGSGGPETVCSTIVQDTNIPGNQCLTVHLFDGANLSIQSSCNQGANSASISNSNGQLDLTSSVIQTISTPILNLDNTNLVQSTNSTIDLNKTLPDGSVASLKLNNGDFGGEIMRLDTSNIKSILHVGKGPLGYDNEVLSSVTDPVNTNKISESRTWSDGTIYGYTLLVKDIVAGNPLINEILIALGQMDLRSDGAVVITSPIIVLSTTGGNSSSIVTSDFSGIVNKITFDQNTYTPVVTNVNRITVSAGFAESNYTQIKDICYVNAKVSITIGAGVTTPSFRMSLPISHTAFSADVVMGSGIAYDATPTTSNPLIVTTQLPAGTDALITFTAGVAGSYICKINLSYPTT